MHADRLEQEIQSSHVQDREERASSVRSHESRSSANRREVDRASRDRRYDESSSASRSSRRRHHGADEDDPDARPRSPVARSPVARSPVARSRDGPDERDHERRRDRSDREDYRDSKRRRDRSREPYDRPRRHRDDYHDEESARERRRPPREYDERRRGYDDRSPPSYRRRQSPTYETEPRRRRRSMSPELDEEQREMRSVFVSQLSARVGDRELGIFFDQQAGKVREARVIVDRISRRSKGVGYVEFVELETVQKALTLSGTKLLGIPIVVQYTEAEKNRQAREPAGPPQPHAPSPANSLYVGSLNFALTEEDVRQVFQPFGEVQGVDLHRDPITNKSKGYAFVQFKEVKDAQQALEKMNNFVLAGREIRVGLVGDRNIPMNRGEQQLEREDGPSLNNISRIELMQKLARSDQPAVNLPMANIPRPNIPLATTRNVVMANAFDPEEETERDWDLELRDDVKTECENSYGPVADIFVLKESKGEIYIRFESIDGAVKAVAGLNGRFFGGHQITASHTSDQLFDAKK